MSWLEPKNKALFSFIICVLLTLFLDLFMDLGIIIIIDATILSIIFLLMYVFFHFVHIKIADFLFTIFLVIGFLAIEHFMQSDLAFKISMKSWEKDVTPIVLEQCTTGCSIKNKSIYNSEDVEIHKYSDLNYIYDGNISSDGKNITYRFTYNENCITKELNKEYVVNEGKCEKTW